MSDTPVTSRKYLPGARILLSEKNTRYRILKGSLLVHIAEYSGEGTGRRLPGHLFGTGSSLFGVDTGTLTLLADPADEVLLEESPLISGNSSAEETISEMARWVHHPLFIGKSPKTKDSTWIQPGTSTVETGEQVQVDIDQHEVIFCRVENGAVYELISDMRFTRSSSWFPVLRATTFIAESPALLETSPFALLQGDIDIPGTMQLIHTWASCRVRARWDEFFLEEDLRIYRWLNQELQIREFIIQKKGGGISGVDPDHVVFNRVLSSIRGEQGNSVEPGFTSDYSQARNLFEKISLMAEDAGVRVRQVRLPVSWWKEDNGPLLVLNEKNKLLAAVPVSPGRYRLFDESGMIAEYDQVSQIPLAGSGCMVYPSLPDRKCGFHDIVRSISPGLWKRDILYLVLFGTVTGVLTTAIPVATGLLFSQAIPENNYGLLYAIVIAVAVSLVASAIFDIFREFSFIRLYGKTGAVLEGMVIDRVLKLPPRFFRGFNAGNLVSRIEDIESIRNVCSRVIISMIFGGGLAVFNIVLMYLINPSLTWIVLAFTFGILCASGIIGYFIMKKEKGLLEVQGHFSGITFQILNGIAKISSAGAENRIYLQWEQELKKQIPLKIPVGNYHIYSEVLTSAWPWTLIIMVFLIAGTEIVSGQGSMTQAWFMGYYSALGLFSVALAGICTTLLSFWTIIPMWDRVQPILREETEVNKGYISPGTLSGAIELSHISFSYSEASGRILDDLSLKIRPGEFVAVVGHSGSGKSTLMRILLGFETPDSGSVLYDDQDLSRLNIREVRKQMGVVLQNGQLMAGTIFENIAGSHSLLLEEAWESAKIAGIADDISEMPLNMHTFISEGSTNISGGQKQRILIARAIASQPKILFFDEATSALDNIIQKGVADRLSSLHLTRLIIAHRLSSIVNADRIYVLDNGRILEEGTYDELMKNGGAFARLAQRQIA